MSEVRLQPCSASGRVCGLHPRLADTLLACACTNAHCTCAPGTAGEHRHTAGVPRITAGEHLVDERSADIQGLDGRCLGGQQMLWRGRRMPRHECPRRALPRAPCGLGPSRLPLTRHLETSSSRCRWVAEAEGTMIASAAAPGGVQCTLQGRTFDTQAKKQLGSALPCHTMQQTA